MQGIQKKLLIHILSITTLFLVGISILNYMWAQDTTVDLSEKAAAARADSAAARIEGYLLQKGQNAWTLAQNEQIHAFAEKVSSRQVDLDNDEDYQEMMKSFQRIVDKNSDIKHVYVAVSETDRLYANVEFDYPPGYKVSSRPWYQAAVQSGTLVFTEPYDCPLTHNRVVSAAVPFYNDNGKLLGVALVDILAENIEDTVNEINIFDRGYAFMLDNKGMAIVHPQKKYYMHSLVDMRDSDPDIARVADQMIKGESGIDEITIRNEENYVFYSPISQIGWSIGVVVPKDEIMAPIYALGRVSAITVTVGILVIFLIIIFLTSRITKPLQEFTSLMKNVSNGDYSVRAQVNTRDEVGNLGDSLNHMLEKQENLIRQVINTAYNMGIAGNELAIIVGELKTTLPVVTSELSDFMGKPGIQKNMENSNLLNQSNPTKLLLENLITVNYNNRLMLSNLDDLQKELQTMYNNISIDNNCGLENAMVKINQQMIDTCQITEDMQMDFVELISTIEYASQNINDMVHTLDSVHKTVTSLSLIQSESINRASLTAMELVKWSQILLQLTSHFNLDVDKEHS